MLERVIRVIIAVGIVAKAIAGMMICFSASQKPGPFPVIKASRRSKLVTGSMVIPGLSLPPEGSHLSITEKNMISIIPSQKIGIETPISDPILVTPSIREFRLAADRIPIGMPTIKAINIATNANSMVAGKRSFMVSTTGMRL